MRAVKEIPVLAGQLIQNFRNATLSILRKVEIVLQDDQTSNRIVACVSKHGVMTFKTSTNAKARKFSRVGGSLSIEKPDIRGHRSHTDELRGHFLTPIASIDQIDDPDLPEIFEKPGGHAIAPQYKVK